MKAMEVAPAEGAEAFVFQPKTKQVITMLCELSESQCCKSMWLTPCVNNGRVYSFGGSCDTILNAGSPQYLLQKNENEVGIISRLPYFMDYVG